MNVRCLYVLPLAALLFTGCVTHQYTTVATPPPPGPTIAEVQSMSQAHVSDSVIISQIQNSNTRYQLTADQIISLKNAGVSDTVINAMINTASKPQPQATTTTVVQGPYVYPPYVYVDPWPGIWWGWGGPYYHGYYGHYHHWR